MVVVINNNLQMSNLLRVAEILRNDNNKILTLIVPYSQTLYTNIQNFIDKNKTNIQTIEIYNNENKEELIQIYTQYNYFYDLKHHITDQQNNIELNFTIQT